MSGLGPAAPARSAPRPGVAARCLVCASLYAAVTVACGPVPQGSPLGALESTLDARRSIVGREEAPIGNLIADAMLEAARERAPDTRLAFVAGGLIGYDRVRRRNGVYPPGPVYETTVAEMLPFDDEVVLVELSGLQLRDVFERGVSRSPRSAAYFLQVSRGVRVVADTRAAPQRLSSDWRSIEAPGRRVVRLELDGEPVRDDRIYRAATHWEVARGEYGHVTLSGIATVPVGPVRGSLATYIGRHSSVTPRTTQRTSLTGATREGGAWLSLLRRW